MLGELAALGAAIAWTVSAVLYKSALSKTEPLQANILRLGCTSVILLVFVISIGRFYAFSSLSVNALVLSALSGLIGLGAGDTLYMMSLKQIEVSLAVPLTCTYPLFSLVFALIIQPRNVAFEVVVAAVAIVFGIWLLTKGDAPEGPKIKGFRVKGALYALGAAVLWAVSITMINAAVTLPETSTLDGALVVNTFRVVSVAVFLAAITPLVGKKSSFAKVQLRSVVLLILAGVVALGLGWSLLAYSFLQIPEARAVPISSTTPLFAVFLGVTFLRERISIRNVAGATIIVIGIFVLFLL
jgi:DME family drug/metabolite transporter